MTLFQILSISILAVLFLREVAALRRDRALGKLLRGAVWLAAGIAIARPDWVQALAETAGINRGADFVFYLFVLAFLGVTFYFYSRIVRLRREITHLVRRQALREARRGGATGSGEPTRSVEATGSVEA